MNASRKIILFISSIVFLGLFFFPPWYETNGQYVKQLGRYFLFSEPVAVPVECYLVGCVTAPASYFRVVLDWRAWVETLSMIAFIAVGLFLLFRTRADGNSPSVGDPKTRLAFSALVALALPVSMSPVLLVGTYGLQVPMILFSGEDNWFWGSVLFPIVFFAYAGGVYIVASVGVWVASRRRRESSPEM